MELRKRVLEPDKYYYLNTEDGKLYDQVKDSNHWKDVIIKRLLIDKAKASQAAHCDAR